MTLSGGTAKKTTKRKVWARMTVTLLHDGGVRVHAKPMKRVMLLAHFAQPEIVPVGPQMRPYLRWQFSPWEVRYLIRWLGEHRDPQAYRLIAALRRVVYANEACACA